MRFGNASNRASLPRVQGGFSAERRPSRCDLVVRRIPEFAHFAPALLCAVKLSKRLASPEFCALCGLSFLGYWLWLFRSASVRRGRQSPVFSLSMVWASRWPSLRGSVCGRQSCCEQPVSAYAFG